MNEGWYDPEGDRKVWTGTRTRPSGRAKRATPSCSATSKRTLRTPNEPRRGLGSTNHALLIQRRSLFKNIYLQKLYLTVTDSFYQQKLYSIEIGCCFVFFPLALSFYFTLPTRFAFKAREFANHTHTYICRYIIYIIYIYTYNIYIYI